MTTELLETDARFDELDSMLRLWRIFCTLQAGIPRTWIFKLGQNDWSDLHGCSVLISDFLKFLPCKLVNFETGFCFKLKTKMDGIVSLVFLVTPGIGRYQIWFRIQRVCFQYGLPIELLPPQKLLR